jgi:bifunctional UDP-N-acetylglucosamine pyrophosphorylase/glucosamine-1-phosphate N-acetyltransferase
MKSQRAKVLHLLGGRPLVAHVVRSVFRLSPETIIAVVGYQAEEVERAIRDEVSLLAKRGEGRPPDLRFAVQHEQRGTGHAVIAARDHLRQRSGSIIILAGDGPMIQTETLRRLAETHAAEGNDATVMTALFDDPHGYGRVVRDGEGKFVRIVEQKDASTDQLAIREVGVSIYCFEIPRLLDALDRLTDDNAQGEYYLTDVPQAIASRGGRVGTFLQQNAEEVLGINNRIELADLEDKLRRQKLRELMLSGVTVVDPSATWVHQDVEVGQDTVIHPQVIIEGSTLIGAGCEVQSWTRIRDSKIGDGVKIKNSSVIEESVIHAGASVGPFARLRAEAEIGEKAAIGNFVEVKKSKIGRGTKASHLTYLGDATLGERVNIGAGTVTCNYDGVRKHNTIIEDDVKIGSDTMLVAPVKVGRGSVTGAGTVVTKDVPEDSLAVGVPAQIKKKLKSERGEGVKG